MNEFSRTIAHLSSAALLALSGCSAQSGRPVSRSTLPAEIRSSIAESPALPGSAQIGGAVSGQGDTVEPLSEPPALRTTGQMTGSSVAPSMAREQTVSTSSSVPVPSDAPVHSEDDIRRSERERQGFRISMAGLNHILVNFRRSKGWLAINDTTAACAYLGSLKGIADMTLDSLPRFYQSLSVGRMYQCGQGPNQIILDAFGRVLEVSQSIAMYCTEGRFNEQHILTQFFGDHERYHYDTSGMQPDLTRGNRNFLLHAVTALETFLPVAIQEVSGYQEYCVGQ